MKKILFLCWALVGILPYVSAQTIDMTYTTEFQYNLRNRTNWCNLLQLEATCPIGANGRAAITLNSMYKLHAQRIADDWQGFSNIEENNLPCEIALLGYTHQFHKSEVFVGIRNLGEDYFKSPNMTMFTNSSCGIFPTLSYNYPLASYPLSGLCVDYAGTFGDWTVRGSVYNGKAYSGWRSDDNPFLVRFKQDGVFGLTETTYTTASGRYYGGFALHQRFGLLQENDGFNSSSRTNVVWWGYVDQCLWKVPTQEVNLLVQYSQSAPKGNDCQLYAGMGATWSDFKEQKKRHEIGLFVLWADFKFGNEVAGELTYCYNFKYGLLVQPALHVIKNTDGVYTILMLRLSYALSLL